MAKKCDCCDSTVYVGDKLRCKGCGSIICKSCQSGHYKQYKENGLSWTSYYCSKCGRHRKAGQPEDIYGY